MINLFKSIFTNQYGTMNFLPAALTTLSGLLSTPVNETEYELYRKQAQEYVSNARENAKLIRQKGEIDLRNLRYKNKLERGEDIATVGARGGKMSGSNLDVVLQKEKVRKMNEAVVEGDSITRSLIEMTNGYRRAASVYGTMAAKAEADKTAVWGHIMKGLTQYVASTAQDAKLVNRMKSDRIMLDNLDETLTLNLYEEYGVIDKPPSAEEIPELNLFGSGSNTKIDFY